MDEESDFQLARVLREFELKSLRRFVPDVGLEMDRLSHLARDIEEGFSRISEFPLQSELIATRLER